MAENESGFLIDGAIYELPSIVGLTNRENRIYYKATGLLVEWSWVSLQTGEITFYDLMQNEGFLPAMAQIAYIREHPEADDAEVASMIDGLNRFELFSSLVDSTIGTEGEDAVPLEDTTNIPRESSKSSSGEKRSYKSNKEKSSGKRSKKSSGQQGGTQEAIGTSESDGHSTSRPLRRVI